MPWPAWRHQRPVLCHQCQEPQRRSKAVVVAVVAAALLVALLAVSVLMVYQITRLATRCWSCTT